MLNFFSLENILITYAWNSCDKRFQIHQMPLLHHSSLCLYCVKSALTTTWTSSSWDFFFFFVAAASLLPMHSQTCFIQLVLIPQLLPFLSPPSTLCLSHCPQGPACVLQGRRTICPDNSVISYLSNAVTFILILKNPCNFLSIEYHPSNISFNYSFSYWKLFMSLFASVSYC